MLFSAQDSGKLRLGMMIVLSMLTMMTKDDDDDDDGVGNGANQVTVEIFMMMNGYKDGHQRDNSRMLRS